MNRDTSRSGLGDLDALMPRPMKPAPSAVPQPVRETPVEPSRRVTKVKAPRALATPRPPRIRTRSQVVYLPDDQIAALDRLSRQSERSKSDLVREAVGQYLQSGSSEAGD